MGYTTKFSGHIALSRKLTMAEAKTLLEYNEDTDLIPQEPERPNRSYMQWVPSESLDAIVWDGNEKFYDYVTWMEWICAWLLQRGIAANGSLVWSGESAADVGTITVDNNAVTATEGAKQPKTVNKPMTLRKLADMALAQATATTNT